MIAKALLAALLVAIPFLIQAQEPYPTKPVTIVVPYPPAGQADLAARPLASALQGILKQPFVVMNRPGAAGAVGNRAVATAEKDGYTILVTLVSITTIPEVEKMFGRPQSYSMDQFAPLALLVADPPVLAVNAQQPWKSVKELVDDAKRRPDDIVYSHSGLYGASHLPMEMFLHAAGIKMRGLGAVGGGPTMALVLGGSSAMWASPPAMAVAQVSAGKMRTLASFGAKRLAAFPGRADAKGARLRRGVLRLVGGVRAGRHAARDTRHAARCDPQSGGHARVHRRDGEAALADQLPGRAGIQQVPRARRGDAAQGRAGHWQGGINSGLALARDPLTG